METLFDNSTTKRRVMIAVNVLSLIVLGVMVQTGGTYLVNAAVICFGEGGPMSAGTSWIGSFARTAADQYALYIQSVKAMGSREYVYAMIFAPLIEEIVFRLIFLRAGKMIMPFWAANLVQAVLFGLYHTMTIQKIYAFILGLIIGCVFHYCPIIYRRAYETDVPASILGVAMTFVFHVVINSAGLFVSPLFPANIPIAAQYVTGFVLMIAAVAVCFILRKRSRG